MKLDLTGGNPSNRRTANIPINYNGSKVAILYPQGGYFHTSMTSPVLIHNGVELKYGKDYRYIRRSKKLRDKYKISSHLAIMLLTPGLTGVISLTASFVGDQYQIYGTKYLNDISSMEFILNLHDPNDIVDLPANLPPKASILDMEKVTSGMVSSVQLIFSIGAYLKDFESGTQPPSTGSTWPAVNID